LHFLYIIYSKKINRYYIGETPDVTIRINLHNQHYFKRNFTKASSDWELRLSFECETKSEALFLEKFIKRMKSKVFIKKTIKNPLILVDILKNNRP